MTPLSSFMSCKSLFQTDGMHVLEVYEMGITQYLNVLVCVLRTTFPDTFRGDLPFIKTRFCFFFCHGLHFHRWSCDLSTNLLEILH
jgi:hypothetical protein